MAGPGDCVRSALVIIGAAEVERWSQLPVGSRLTVLARLQPPDRGSELAAVVAVRGRPTHVASPSAPLRLVEKVRQGLRASVEHRGVEARGLVPALVLGDTSALTPELTKDFETTGLSHLTAVSGANLTLLLAFLLFAARWLGVRGRWLRLVGLLGVVAFVGLCRTEPSVLRAAAMGLVALAALGSGGRRAGLRNLALAMIVLLLVDPYLSRSVGFALSVLASGGIIWWARSWASLLCRWLPRLIAEALTVPLAAQLSTLPVVAAISGQVSVAGLMANAAGRAVHRARDRAWLPRRGQFTAQRSARRRLGLRRGLERAGDHLGGPGRGCPARSVVALAGHRGVTGLAGPRRARGRPADAAPAGPAAGSAWSWQQ